MAKAHIMALIKSRVGIKKIRPPSKPLVANKLHLLDLPEDQFKLLVWGIKGESKEDKFLVDYNRWTSRYWSGPSVRMTRSYSINAGYKFSYGRN